MIVLDAILLVLGLAAGTGDSLQARGAGIREAKDEEFPFQVSIKTMNNRHLCGGAIITPMWVLTVSNCLEKHTSVQVICGSADSNSPLQTVDSSKIVLQNELNLQKRNRLALINLKAPIQFSKTVAQAKLPTSKAHLLNTTKLSGWNVDMSVDLPPSLFVIDKYFVIPKDCYSTRSHLPVPLAVDEFCGMDEDLQNGLSSPGTIVSKSAVVLGILPQRPLAPSEPYIYVKMSEHGQWIKDTLSSDAQYISWVDTVPKDSGHALQAMGFSLIMAVAVCLIYGNRNT